MKWRLLTEINAHSPRYSINNGLVTSKNAGAASIPVAIPTLMAYFTSDSFSLEPMVHKACFARPIKVSWERDGVWIVLGACGWTFGNQDLLWPLRERMIEAKIVLKSHIQWWTEGIIFFGSHRGNVAIDAVRVYRPPTPPRTLSSRLPKSRVSTIYHESTYLLLCCIFFPWHQQVKRAPEQTPAM